MASGQIAHRYAQAWLSAASEVSAYDAVASDCRSLALMLEKSPDLQRFINSPVIEMGVQAKALEALATSANFHAVTRSMLGVLVKNRRLHVLAAVVSAALTLIDQKLGHMEAVVTTAKPMDDAARSQLEQTLAQRMGKSITLAMHVDPALIGGMVIRVGSTLIDDTVKTKLERLQRQLLGSQAA